MVSSYSFLRSDWFINFPSIDSVLRSSHGLQQIKYDLLIIHITVNTTIITQAERHSDELNVLKYDVEGENNKQLKVEMLLQGVMVRGLPTLLLYNEGKPLATHSGAITEEELEGWLEEHLFSQVDSAISGDSGARTKSTQPKMDITNNDDGCEKRGLVSFASQFGRDDYML